MTAITPSAGLSKQLELMFRGAIGDLNYAINNTPQEMALKRTESYFAGKMNTKGLIGIYYRLLTAIAIDPSQTAEKLLDKAAPKVKEDIKLLEAIRTSAEKGSVDGLKEAMKAGLTKDVLLNLFDVTTWSNFFGTDRPQMVKAVKLIAAAIPTTVIVEAKAEEVAKPVINQDPVPPKRKHEEAPLAQPEAKKDKPVTQRQMSRYSEEDKKIEAAIQAAIAAQETKEQEERANEALARELQEQVDVQTARDAQTAQKLAEEDNQRAIDAAIYD